VLRTLDDLLEVAVRLHAGDLPRPLQVLDAVSRVQKGGEVREVARSLRVAARRLEAIAAEGDPISAVLGASLEEAATPEVQRRPREMLGQLLLGELAERAFETIYKETMGTQELTIEDDRQSRNETDYRVLNGARRPVFRINIKFHGTLFRNARDLVGLDQEDCFALATYKIHQGLQKQEDERLPYLFAIVSAPGLTGGRAGAAIPEDLVHYVSLAHQAPKFPGKRSLEESVVSHLLAVPQSEPFGSEVRALRTGIQTAEWRVLSARKADQLLRKLLFERVYAVRVRAFARNYRNAELDMHFSLREDLTRLDGFLGGLRERGLQGLAVDLERGVV
jgi:hypothetical protein